MIVEKSFRKRGSEIRTSIVQASLCILRQEGWHGLTMRKIAKLIHYSTPVIYAQFKNKAAINKELAQIGFSELLHMIKKAKSISTKPSKQLELMWLAYADFAQREQELYGLMFGAGAPESFLVTDERDFEEMNTAILAVIRQLPGKCASENTYATKVYYTLWSFIHGLSAIRVNRTELPAALNRQFLADTINLLYTC